MWCKDRQVSNSWNCYDRRLHIYSWSPESSPRFFWWQVSKQIRSYLLSHISDGIYMVGRGWLLLWIWFMSLLCALCGSLCRSGEEYYSNKEGRCLPCTRCTQPEMVVSMPCYLYQDAVCTPTTQFLTNMKSSRTVRNDIQAVLKELRTIYN